MVTREIYQETGKRSAHTEFVDHYCRGVEFIKITRIVGYWQNISPFLVIGLEISYDGIPIVLLGSEKSSEKPMIGILNLGEDEYVKEIAGRSGEQIHQLQIITTKGRSLRMGGNKGGQPFKLELKGHFLRDISVGLGSYINVIGAHFSPLSLHTNNP